VAHIIFSPVSGQAESIVTVHNQWDRISYLASYQTNVGGTSAILVEDASATEGIHKVYSCCEESQSSGFRASVPSVDHLESLVVCGDDAVIATNRELWTSRLLQGDNSTSLRSTFNDSVVTKSIKNNIMCDAQTSRLYEMPGILTPARGFH
jgi:hypothetical protein